MIQLLVFVKFRLHFLLFHATISPATIPTMKRILPILLVLTAALGAATEPARTFDLTPGKPLRGSDE